MRICIHLYILTHDYVYLSTARDHNIPPKNLLQAFVHAHIGAKTYERDLCLLLRYLYCELHHSLGSSVPCSLFFIHLHTNRLELGGHVARLYSSVHEVCEGALAANVWQSTDGLNGT